MGPPDREPPAADTLKVIRGAAWSVARYLMRAANRFADRVGRHPTTAGIRLVRSLTEHPEE